MNLFPPLQRLHGDLRLKIFISINLTMLLTALLFISADVYIQQTEQRNHLIQNYKTTASLLAASVRIGVISENNDYIKGPVEQILVQPHVIRVFISTRDNRILYNYPKMEKNTSPAVPWIGHNRRHLNFYEDAGNYYFIHPITDFVEMQSAEALYFDTNEEKIEKIIAYSCVQISKDILSSDRKAILVKALIGLCVFLLLSFSLSYFIISSTIAPLKQLLNKINTTTPEQIGKDDLNILTDTYSHLLENLEQSFLVNNELRQSLSEKVKERTSELKKANQILEQTVLDLKQSQMQLIQAEKMATLGQIAAGIAHEVNNAINFISGSLEPLMKTIKNLEIEHNLDFSKELSYPLDRLAQNMRTGVQRVASIVKDLSTFARPAAAAMKEVDLNHELDFALRFIEHEYKGRIVIKRSYDELKPVLCHARTINQVFLNIFLNAVYSISDTGWITITTTMVDDMVRVRIQDTGCGIDPAIMGKIFEPFFTTKPSGKGTGMGLGISYSIIKEHNGTITIESVKGEGTTVEIHLPVAS